MPATDGDLVARKKIAAQVLMQTGAVPRKIWGALEPVRPLTPDWNYDSIVVHYSGHDSYPNMASIQGFDLEHRHWDDVAYHSQFFLTDGSTKVVNSASRDLM
ncbi:hypothetical protein [Acetobacter sp. DsW_063]|uniref:hypothetical protein n=1 Tax=Acetobacter sp. DsW_063 TaxID=1514894 RepID=UPI000A3CA4C5|nr:hypothetical protein [Acetobacter sp. DsW_063]OUJ17123.1 hypothetical protein HK28_00005 [Acetobacter sp. DsW_063]